MPTANPTSVIQDTCPHVGWGWAHHGISFGHQYTGNCTNNSLTVSLTASLTVSLSFLSFYMGQRRREHFEPGEERHDTTPIQAGNYSETAMGNPVQEPAHSVGATGHMNLQGLHVANRGATATVIYQQRNRSARAVVNRPASVDQIAESCSSEIVSSVSPEAAPVDNHGGDDVGLEDSVSELREDTVTCNDSEMLDREPGPEIPDPRAVDWWSLEYDKLDEQLTCPVCQTALVDPQTTPCGHTFCLQCLTSAQEVRVADAPERPFRCPIDREVIEPSEIRAAPFIVNAMVNDLVVSCPNSNEGCQFKDKRWLLETHLGLHCPYVVTSCIGTCKKKSRRHWLEKELCPHGVLPCARLCGAVMPASEVAQHLASECAKSSWSCEHCGISFPAAESAAHTTACSKNFQRCPGKDYGCEWSTLQPDTSELGLHIENCILARVAPVLRGQDERIKTLELQNATLRDQLSSTRRQVRRDFAQLDLQLLFEYEKMRRDLDHTASSADSSAKQTMMLTRENIRLTEDIAFLRAGVNRLHHQMQHVVHKYGPFANHSSLLGGLRTNYGVRSEEVCDKGGGGLQTPPEPTVDASNSAAATESRHQDVKL